MLTGKESKVDKENQNILDSRPKSNSRCSFGQTQTRFARPFAHDYRVTDEVLTRIAEAWPSLSEPIRRAILALIDSARVE